MEGEGSGCSTRLLYTSFASALSEDCEENGQKQNGKWKLNKINKRKNK
jgi:hypothetical protein